MNEQIKFLIQKANTLIPPKNGYQTRYPEPLKEIISTLVIEFKMSPKEVIKHIPISPHLASMWPKQKRKEVNFQRIRIKPPLEVKTSLKKRILKKIKMIKINQGTWILILQGFQIILFLFLQ